MRDDRVLLAFYVTVSDVRILAGLAMSAAFVWGVCVPAAFVLAGVTLG